MEKEINRHLESIERLEKEVDDDIDKAIKAFDIKDIIDDPLVALLEVTEVINAMLDDEYHARALKEGIKFARNIKL